MAEGGEWENENTWLDRNIDHDGDDDDDEEEVDRTTPFVPGGSSTPYHGGEQHEMSTMPSEQSGLDETVPLLQQPQREWVWNTLKSLYPDASSIDLEAYLDPKSKRLMIKKAGTGKKAYPLYAKEKLTQRPRLNPNLSLEIKLALGQPAGEKIVQDNTADREDRQRLKEAEKQQKEAATTSSK